MNIKLALLFSIVLCFTLSITCCMAAQAKTITESDGTEYTCTKVKSCDEKLKAAYAEIRELKRKRQQIKEVVVEKIVETKQRKNSLILEGRKDHTNLKTEVSGNTAKVSSEKNLVLGLDYYRREILDGPIGLGLGVDTNAVLKLMLGLDF